MEMAELHKRATAALERAWQAVRDARIVAPEAISAETAAYAYAALIYAGEAQHDYVTGSNSWLMAHGELASIGSHDIDESASTSIQEMLAIRVASRAVMTATWELHWVLNPELAGVAQ